MVFSYSNNIERLLHIPTVATQLYTRRMEIVEQGEKAERAIVLTPERRRR